MPVNLGPVKFGGGKLRTALDGKERPVQSIIDAHTLSYTRIHSFGAFFITSGVRTVDEQDSRPTPSNNGPRFTAYPGSVYVPEANTTVIQGRNSEQRLSVATPTRMWVSWAVEGNASSLDEFSAAWLISAR